MPAPPLLQPVKPIGRTVLPPAPTSLARGGSPACATDAGSAVPRWYAGLVADLETSVYKALGKALEATEVEARKRADRQEDLLTQLLANRTAESRWAQSDQWSVSTGDVQLMSLLPKENIGDPKSEEAGDPEDVSRATRQYQCPEWPGLLARGVQDREEHHVCSIPGQHLSSLKACESDATLLPASTAQEISEVWRIDADADADVRDQTPWWLPKSQIGSSMWTSAGTMRDLSKLQRCVTSSAFNSFCTLVIVLNAVYMGVVSDLLVKSAFHNFGSDGSDIQLSMTTMIFETGFLGWYVVELLLKLVAFGWAFFNGEDRKWNAFDTILVVVGIIGLLEIGYDIAWLRIARALVKLVKALRVFRLVRFFEELRVIMLSIAHSLHTFFWAMVMLWLILYMCAIVFVQGVADYIRNSSEYTVPDEIQQDCFEDWGSMHKAMITEYKAIAGGGPWGHVTDGLWHTGPFYYYFFLFYIAVVVLAVFKLLTGIFVQKARAAAEQDRDQTIEQNMIKVFKDIDSDRSGFISRSEFKAAVESDVAKDYWSMLHIKPSDARKLFSLMDTSCDEHVDIQEFISGCQKFGGWARNIDMAVAISRIHEVSMHLSELMVYVEECFDCHFGHRGPLPPPTESLGERVARHRKVRPSRVLFEFESQLEAFNRTSSFQSRVGTTDSRPCAAV